MEIKKLNYNETDNITKLVKCLDKDKDILSNIPHQPGEFSNLPFKKTFTCDVHKGKKKGDYYEYYDKSKQLATFKYNIKTIFNNIRLIKYDNKLLIRIKTKLSIYQQFTLKDSNKYQIEKGICFLLKGKSTWGEFIQDWLPYLFFAKDLLKKDKEIHIIFKEKIIFDSFNFILKNILGLSNNIIFLKINESISVKELYIIECNGPFASGLFPYQGHCTCPVILYKELYNFIQSNYLNNKFEHKDILIYTKRNTGNTRRLISNENDIINNLQNYCSKKGLKFINFFYKDYSFEKRIELFNKAKYIVGVHGSANFHTLFCNKEVKIVEFICIKDCHSTQLVNLSYGLEYWQIPIKEHGQFEKIININQDSINSLNEILNKL